MPKLADMIYASRNWVEVGGKKWEAWEAANEAKNEECLQEMRSILAQHKAFDLELYKLFSMQEDNFTIPSEDDMWNLMQADALRKRIDDQRVFALYNMSKEEIAASHFGDFLAKFSYVGLDLIELRAVYACLPKVFLNDPNDYKMIWRNQVREKLFKWTVEEKEGYLSADIIRHPVYRHLPPSIKVTM
mmetsp:Transcript_17033/g.21002  ORF Transcript_17033/g.21002 Transcript_17033/m.21002 type:complete len:188 (+) Transcript_17033:328-891(+)|eukprot:CAMPEP_0204826508 /NCGR_PEP_ID=MMETSP1346-20131115/4182_1 /ASSEMBLY_ACC=CAM_ASM_000771 /TAXON_ID=215587 /ORGANISM="Aplanochytrium stocchinoi, Strain GSBS06" /LENGTH=187 /DNA_ID=CAMNT_0051954565 /DNA_START=279 /DNA_END=842 /DNA_ORIENTATION=+